MAFRTLRQVHIAGRTKGLRPSQKKHLDRLSRCRHPREEGSDLITLERIAREVLELELSLHLLVDPKGLCRLLWIGSLHQSGKIIEHLPNSHRLPSYSWSLISCQRNQEKFSLQPSKEDAIVALELAPIYWLRFTASNNQKSISSSTLWQPSQQEESGWELIERSSLRSISERSKSLCSIKINQPIQTNQAVEKVLLLTILKGKDPRTERELAELEGLVRSAGAETVGVAKQQSGAIHPQTIWGKGKLQEAALNVRRYGASVVITDRELTPGQARNLESLLDCPVMDRSELILDIFAQRASSAAGRLQVELAQLRYRLPRLVGRGQSLSRQGGGIGTRGPGESQLEKDRRAIARRIEKLKKGLEQLTDHRARLRKKRSVLPQIALVGYTNAGKSSIMNALCDLNDKKKVLSENNLFATLDPITRHLKVPQTIGAPREFLITDTVGFIREIPTSLIEAFRATLEETIEADLLLLVVDLSNPDWQNQLETVHTLLNSLGSKAIRQVLANQIDRCESISIEAIRKIEPNVLYLSAKSGAGLQGLKAWITNQFSDQRSQTPARFSLNTNL